MAKMTGKFMVLEQRADEKRVYLTLLDLEGHGQFQIAAPVRVDEKSLLVPLNLEIEGVEIRRGYGKNGAYTSVSCQVLRSVPVK